MDTRRQRPPEEDNYMSTPIKYTMLAQQLYTEQHRFQNGSSGNILLEEVLKSRRTILPEGREFKRCWVEQENATPAMLAVRPLLSNQCDKVLLPHLGQASLESPRNYSSDIQQTLKGCGCLE